MCPLRFIVIFLSASVAGYIAWKSLWIKADDSVEKERSDATETARRDGSLQKQSDSTETTVQRDGSLQKGCSRFVSAFWIVVDMASGRYLWRILKPQESDQKAKSL